MSRLLISQPPEFAGFGPSILAQQTRGRVKRHLLPADRMAGRAMLHDHCPLEPGVYGWLDSRQQVCYVGKSKSLRTRLLSYFAKQTADQKSHRIRQTAQTLVWEPMSNELLALIREQELIYRWRPEFNTQGQPVKRQPAFLCFGGDEAPNAFFARRLTAKATHVFGPVAGTGRLRAAIDSLNQVFHLRDCPDRTRFDYNEQPRLFDHALTAQCIRFELGTCPAPCAGKCSRSAYQARVQQAIRFVAGEDTTVLVKLALDMKRAAEAHSFERATVLRDHLANLTWLKRCMQALRKAKAEFNGILPIEARKNRTAWLILKGGRLVGSAAEPQAVDRALSAANFLARTAAEAEAVPANIMEMNLQLIMISWFRKHPEMARTLIPFDRAIEVCQRRSTGERVDLAVPMGLVAESEAGYRVGQTADESPESQKIA